MSGGVDRIGRVYFLKLGEIETLRGMLDTLVQSQEENDSRTPAQSALESVLNGISGVNEDFQRGAPRSLRQKILGSRKARNLERSRSRKAGWAAWVKFWVRSPNPGK
jgi:hypothetical protein